MPTFGTVSKRNLAKAHPKIQAVMNEAIKRIDFKVLDSERGEAAQTRAFLTGHSKARWKQSAHNYHPSIAVDLFPAPFDKLYRVIMEVAKELGVPLRSGDDWDMNGLRPGDKDNWDAGHYELHPWREWAKGSGLVKD